MPLSAETLARGASRALGTMLRGQTGFPRADVKATSCAPAALGCPGNGGAEQRLPQRAAQERPAGENIG
jgi:hypothetical protein